MSEKNKLLSSFKERTDKIIKDLPKFQPRGKDTFAKSLESGPRSNVENAFTKTKRDIYGNKSSHPYLQSRFLINPPIKDPFKRDSRDGLQTVRDDERNFQQQQAKRGIFGNPESLKSYEAAAKASSKIGDDLQTAMSIGGEKNMSDAVYAAQAASRENEILSRTPGRNSSGDYITNDPSWQNANMMDGFNNARTDAVAAQNLVDYISSGRLSVKQKLNNMKLDLDTPSFDVRTGY